MIISSSKEFIFIHLEKCGGTSVESSLQDHLAWYDMILGSTGFGETIQSAYFERYGIDQVKQNMLWKHSTALDIHRFIGFNQWDSFKKISVVRDPVEIVVSLYNFSRTIAKYHIGRINPTTWKEKLRTKDFPNQFPFTEAYFLEYIQSVIDDNGIDGFTQNILEKNYPFIKPQVDRLSIGNINDLGKLIDLSVINESWENLIDYIGFDNKIELLHLNKSEKQEIELSPRSIKNIKKHFAIDYQVIPRYTSITW